MNAANPTQTVERIHASGKQLVLAITGGGSGAISALLEVPGASASVLEAVVPYASTALAGWLGGPVDQFCSERTARAMAMAAFERARQLAAAEPRVLRGIGVTASLATNRPRRGPHRIHAAWQSADTTAVASCELPKDQRSRAEEEQIATQLILAVTAEACGLTDPWGASEPLDVTRRSQFAPPGWAELLLGERAAVLIESNNESGIATQFDPAAHRLVFSGAFNPPHAGHLRMAEFAARRCGGQVTFELSIANVDKPPLDFIEIHDRLEQLTGRPVLLTRAATFVEKSALVPGCVFVVGIDTVERVGEPRYYGSNAAARDAAIDAIADRGCRFLVFGRAGDGRFRTLADIQLPPKLRSLCDEVAEAEFREDVSSSELRGDSQD